MNGRSGGDSDGDNDNGGDINYSGGGCDSGVKGWDDNVVVVFRYIRKKKYSFSGNENTA